MNATKPLASVIARAETDAGYRLDAEFAAAAQAEYEKMVAIIKAARVFAYVHPVDSDYTNKQEELREALERLPE